MHVQGNVAPIAGRHLHLKEHREVQGQDDVMENYVKRAENVIATYCWLA